MTAPEPLALEKFIKDVAAKYPHGGLVWLGDPSRYPRKVWVILDKFGDEGVRQTDYARRWEDLVEQFYGHPVRVVARDEAAELRAENECLRQDRQPDYLYNPTDWEYTVPWCDRHLFDAEIGDADGAVRYRTAYDGPDVFAADVPIEFDDAGCPVRSEIQWFDSQEAAEEALLRVAAPEEQP